MTVENDGVPPGEGEASAQDGLDPPTELLPLDAASARKLAVDDAAARKAQLNAQGPPPPVPPVPPQPAPPGAAPATTPPSGTPPLAAPATELPPPPPPGAGPAPTPPSGTRPPAKNTVAEEPTRVLPLDHQAGRPPSAGAARTTQGSLEGDLFDDDEPAPGRAP